MYFFPKICFTTIHSSSKYICFLILQLLSCPLDIRQSQWPYLKLSGFYLVSYFCHLSNGSDLYSDFLDTQSTLYWIHYSFTSQSQTGGGKLPLYPKLPSGRLTETWLPIHTNGLSDIHSQGHIDKDKDTTAERPTGYWTTFQKVMSEFH